jgi:hypothetical protein
LALPLCHDFNSLLLAIVAFSLPDDFFCQEAGEKGWFGAAELRALRAEMRVHMQQAVAVNAPDAVAVIGPQPEPSNYFSFSH